MTTGIIIPPGHIKKLVQKTAEHVALNGSQFQKMIHQRQQGKMQFAFLDKQNPYRTYYDHMVGEFSRKIIEQAQNSERKQVEKQVKQQIEQIKQQAAEQLEQQKVAHQNNPQAQFLQRIFQQLQEPDADRYTAQTPEKITPNQIALIQHTAQYSARNGKNFLIALSEREKNNPQFQFLKASSKNNVYFNALTQAYSNILALTAEDMDKLIKYAENPSKILQKCQKIYQYHSAKQQQGKNKKQNNKEKKEQNIDWNDFQLVDTIVFEEQLTSDILKPRHDGIKTHLFTGNKNLEQKVISQAKKKQVFSQCHSCGQKVLASQMTKHFKICLRGQKQTLVK